MRFVKNTRASRHDLVCLTETRRDRHVSVSMFARQNLSVNRIAAVPSELKRALAKFFIRGLS